MVEIQRVLTLKLNTSMNQKKIDAVHYVKLGALFQIK